MYNDYFSRLGTPPYNNPGYATTHYIYYTMRFQVITLHYMTFNYNNFIIEFLLYTSITKTLSKRVIFDIKGVHVTQL